MNVLFKHTMVVVNHNENNLTQNNLINSKKSSSYHRRKPKFVFFMLFKSLFFSGHPSRLNYDKCRFFSVIVIQIFTQSFSKLTKLNTF